MPEPTPKVPRRTLAERAGEPINPSRSHIPPPGTRPNPNRSDSTTAQVGSRGASNGLRHPSTASTANSTSTTRGSNRTTGAARHARIPSAPNPVPIPAEDEEEPEVGVMGKRKGMPNSAQTLALRKTRTCHNMRQQAAMSAASQHSVSYIRTCSDSSGQTTRSSSAGSRQTSGSSATSTSLRSAPSASAPTPALNAERQAAGQQAVSRDISLNTAFAGLSLTPRHPSMPKHRPSLDRIKEENISPSKIPKYSCTPSLRHTQSHQVLATPSPLKPKPSLNGLYTPQRTSKRNAREEVPVYLTKDKLTPTPRFTAWDTKGRLEDMESLYATLRTQFASAADSKTALEESLSLYKARGILYRD